MDSMALDNISLMADVTHIAFVLELVLEYVLFVLHHCQTSYTGEW